MMGTSNSVNVLCANKYNILFEMIGTMVVFAGGALETVFLIIGLVTEIPTLFFRSGRWIVLCLYVRIVELDVAKLNFEKFIN